MSLLDDVIVNAASAVDTVGKVAGGVVDRSRIRVSSAELKKKISAQFETLGRYIYDTNLAGSTDDTVVKEYINSITVLINELKSLQDSLSADTGKISCPKCCCKNAVESLFCKKCGASLDFARSYTADTAAADTVAGKQEAAECVEESAPVVQDDSFPE